MNPFQQASRVALRDAITRHSRQAKLGHFLSEEALDQVIEDLMELFETSRQLRMAGDRFTRQQSEGVTPPSRSERALIR